MSEKQNYWLMDGRATFDVDKASILEWCESLEDANSKIEDYGNDTCIVNADTHEVVDCLLWRNNG